MLLQERDRLSAHFFAGCGGDVCGMHMAGWRPYFAVEVDPHRCRTLRLNFPALVVYEGPIQKMLLADYPAGRILAFCMTFPCDHYTLAANVHRTWTGDSLYLEAMREVVLYGPEWVAIENVWGMKKFKRVMETFRALPNYYCTEFVLHGEDFTLQRKTRVFMILHRQPYTFPPLEQYRLPRPGNRLRDYLELDAPVPPIPPYIYTRLRGDTYRDRPKVYDPEQDEPVNLFTNIGRDRSLFLVRDERCPRGVRPFQVREVANLHGFPRQPHPYQFAGPLGARFDMVVDSVMPLMAYVLGQAANDYFAAIPSLADPPSPLGCREVPSLRQQQLEEARSILADEGDSWDDLCAAEQLALWQENGSIS
jgi:DNA (cytosine-5)-methyltransferase 1